MKLTAAQRLAAPFAGFFKGVQAAASGSWEGYEVNRLRYRPGMRLVSQDTDLDYGTREKMLSEARALCQTFPLARRILRQYANYCVGTCRAQWNTGNAEHNKAYERYWMNWMNRADARGMHHFCDLTRFAVMAPKRDGDLFAQFVQSGPRGEELQIALIEGDRVGNYRGGSTNFDETTGKQRVIGGVVLDAVGRPAAYRVNDRNDTGQFKNAMDIPALSMCHVFDPDRVDAYRGVTAFHAVLNTLRDLKEILDSEKSAVKVNSKLSLLVKTVFGGAQGNGNGPLNLFTSNDSTADSAQAVNQQEVNDSTVAYMFPNEDMKAHQSDRPSAAWQGFVQLMVQQIAIGMDLPPGVVFNMAGLTGPAVRFDINQAARTFAATIESTERRFLTRICGPVISNAIARGIVPFNANWTEFKWQRPPFISIDLGRDSKAGIDENKAGLMTGSEWFAENGKDWQEEIEQLAIEAAFRKEMAAKHGVDVGDIRAEEKKLEAKPTEDEE
jgi:lambda family phage portal protein